MEKVLDNTNSKVNIMIPKKLNKKAKGPNIWCWKLLFIFPSYKYINDLVIPQPGHGKPVNILKGQNDCLCSIISIPSKW